MHTHTEDSFAGAVLLLFLKAIGVFVCFPFFFFWPQRVACKTLVPQAGTEPPPPVVEVRRLTHGAAGEVPTGNVESKLTAHNTCNVQLFVQQSAGQKQQLLGGSGAPAVRARSALGTGDRAKNLAKSLPSAGWG